MRQLLCLFIIIGVLLISKTYAIALVNDIVNNATLWDRVTRKYVVPGSLFDIQVNLVNYTGIENDPGLEKKPALFTQAPVAFVDFRDYIAALANATIDNLNKAEFYAFFINVYNALAVNLIVQVPMMSCGLMAIFCC